MSLCITHLSKEFDLQRIHHFYMLPSSWLFGEPTTFSTRILFGRIARAFRPLAYDAIFMPQCWQVSISRFVAFGLCPSTCITSFATELASKYPFRAVPVFDAYRVLPQSWPVSILRLVAFLGCAHVRRVSRPAVMAFSPSTWIKSFVCYDARQLLKESPPLLQTGISQGFHPTPLPNNQRSPPLQPFFISCCCGLCLLQPFFGILRLLFVFCFVISHIRICPNNLYATYHYLLWRHSTLLPCLAIKPLFRHRTDTPIQLDRTGQNWVTPAAANNAIFPPPPMHMLRIHLIES